MTEIHCEFCGPTRIAPHDVNCPNTDRVRKGDVIGWVGPAAAPVNIADGGMHYQPLPPGQQWPIPVIETYEFKGQKYPKIVDMITPETHPEMFSPIVEKATDHYTVSGRRGAECYCGYNPAIEHPEAGRGQLFAYVGQHIKNESGI